MNINLNLHYQISSVSFKYNYAVIIDVVLVRSINIYYDYNNARYMKLDHIVEFNEKYGNPLSGLPSGNYKGVRSNTSIHISKYINISQYAR